jgi:hypothetical protein
MGAAVESLTSLVHAENPYSIPWKELAPRQLEAANELFRERVGAIRLLARRAEENRISGVARYEDLIPLLFVHTTYKSYPEAWFVEGKWDRIGRWLNTITTRPVPAVELSGTEDVDDWINLMGEVGCFLSCSSGTTGKCSIIPADQADRDFISHQVISAMSWATGLPRTPRFQAFTLIPLVRNTRYLDGAVALREAFFKAHRPFPGEHITVGQVCRMVALRRAITEGTAMPADVAAFDEISKARAQALEDSLQSTAEAIVAARDDDIFVLGMLAPIWQVVERIREMGYGAKDFGGDNGCLASGGKKGAQIPDDAREQIFETFNIRPKLAYQFYSMQEINTAMPRCAAGRYHVAPWVMLLILDEAGEGLVAPGADGTAEGRAAFLDMSLSGRWAGLITGDKVTAHFGPCACGHEGPMVGDQIVRFSELPGGDKITCAGTIDAYVRGAA